MVFSSILFMFIYLPVVLFLYYISPVKWRNPILFVVNMIFYGWGEPVYILLMLVSITINYINGILIGKWRGVDDKKAKIVLVVNVVLNLALLGFFKYYNLFADTLNLIPFINLPELNVTLPIGISFYTFQTMSYPIDVYRGDADVQKNYISFGTFVALFPQLIAGPIVKYSDVAERLHILKGRVTMDRIDEGISLFIFGLAKKVLLADGISALWYDVIGHDVNGVWEAGVGLSNASTPLVWLGIISYALQIYFDFSGYSMMGIGMGKMLGFDFPDNFNLPYISRSITEFWRRWHITLSSWFKEYVYIPLGGNRKGLTRQLFNIFVVWFLTGFWHGANWNFIFWGLYYCVLLMIEKIWLLPHLKKGKVWPHIYTMLLVIVGWALFVGSDKGVSLGLLLQKLFVPSGGVSPLYFLRNYGVLLVVSILCCTPLIEKIWNLLKKNAVTRCAAILALLVVSTAYVVGSTNSPFLYFNF